MLTFDYADDLARLRDVARRELSSLDRGMSDGEMVRDTVSRLASSGLLAPLYPETYGGSGMPTPDAYLLAVTREALARECPLVETILAVQALGSYPVLLSGSEAIKREWLPEVARGNVVAAFALSEPDAASDVASLSMKATPDGEGFRLSGVKQWISNAPWADIYTVFARTGNDGKGGITAFVVRGDSPGLTGEALQVGSGNPIGRLTFDGVPVDRGAVVGSLGEGFVLAMRVLDLFRPSVGASAVGMAQVAIEKAISYSLGREAFGKSIGRFQGISHPLAEAAARVEAARLLVYDAARRHGVGDGSSSWRSAMAKLFATESAFFAVDAAVQVHGAAGLVVAHPLQRLVHMVREMRIYEGTSEIQREIIARHLYATAGRQ